MTARMLTVLLAVASVPILWVSPASASWCLADMALLTVSEHDRHPRLCDTPPDDASTDDLVWVEGIRVHRSIAADIAALVAAAEADGHTVTGEGYRSHADQARLRRALCGATTYEIYVMPGHACSVPVARPGHSMHQRGLAIDFTTDGAPINRADPLYGWLADNAARFGLRNFPPEPWHWSTNGK